MYKAIITIFILIKTSIVWAECSPDTINFYLEKGFNQEQITKLCAQASADTPSYQPYQKPIVVVQEGYSGSGNSVEERRAITELKGGIDGRSIEVTDTHLNYISRVCVRAGNSPEKDQRVEKCIDAAFSIARDGLRVTESGAGLLLFGQQQVDVSSSSIIRKHVTANPWDAFPPDMRYLLKRTYEADEPTNSVTIPIRKSSSPGQIVTAIRTIASTTNTGSGQKQSEVAKVLDESYVPPTEEEYIASQPTYDDIKKEEKKKKKWWNPFD